jgi:GntR family transcriptional regulator
MLKQEGVPLYYQLETILRRRILSGECAPGASFRTEEALAAEYRVSRITVRQALSSLQREGLLTRQRGKGTFVSSEARKGVEPFKLTGSLEDLRAMGVRTKTTLLSFGRVRVSADITERLQLPEGTEVVRVERVRFATGVPLSYGLNYLSLAVGERIDGKLLAKMPLRAVLEEVLGIEMVEATQTIEATIADSFVAPLLDIRVGDPLLKIERTIYDRLSKPVEHVYVLYRADKYSYTVRLEKKGP